MITQRHTFRTNVCRILVWITVLVFSANGFAVTDIYLRADTTNVTMPDGRLVPMWGFAQDSAFEAHDGTVTVPGPQLTIDPGEPHVIIHLENNLPEPVSIIIAGQVASVSPVSFEDDEGRDRIRSFTHETPSGNTESVDYEWTNLRPGTFLYQSGSHPAVQVQMGLYGCLKKVFSAGAVNQAYDGIEYDAEQVLVLSEIDPDLHDAVQAGNYGPGQPVTSTIEYTPKYFLINGRAFTTLYVQINGQVVDVIQPTLLIGEVNDRILLRLVNAGIQSHVAVVDNLRGSVIAEDGYTYNYPYDLYAVDLPPAKTKDVLIVPQTEGIYTLYDHTLDLTNDNVGGGGMMVKLDVAAAPPLTPQETAPEQRAVPLDVPIDPVVAAVVDAPSADINNDGSVNFRDVFIFIRSWHARNTQTDGNLADLNNDGIVDENDVTIMMEQLNRSSDTQQPVLRRSSRLRARTR